MAKLTLSDLASLANETSAIATINANNALIETALENTLSRDGTDPNTVSTDLDMDTNRIYNIAQVPLTNTDVASKYYVDFMVGESSDTTPTNPDDVIIEGDLTVDGSVSVGVDLDVVGTITAPTATISTLTINDDIVISGSTPTIVFTDTDTNADSRISADSAAGTLHIQADFNNEIASSHIRFSIDGTEEALLNSTNFTPGSNDGNALGVSGTAWADLFLASGGVINFNAGDVTITHASNLLTIAGGVVAFSSRPTGIQESFIIACSDETTAITAGTAKVTFRMPYAFTVSDVRASLTTAQASGNIFTVDINENGTTILSTKLTIDNTEETSTTAATAAVISDTALADDAEITIDVDQIGNGSATGLKVTIIGFRP